MSDSLRHVIDALAGLFEQEKDGPGAAGAAEAARALRQHRDDPLHQTGAATDAGMEAEIRALRQSPSALPITQLIDKSWDQLGWFHAGLESGSIPAPIARRMLTCELLGPNGALRTAQCRVGFFAQLPDTDYGARNHAAVETFVMLAGRARWRVHPGDWIEKGPGETSHHPSMVLHESVSAGGAFLTAWRWTGDIGMESYRFRDL